VVNRQHGYLPHQLKSAQVLQLLPMFIHQLGTLRHRFISPQVPSHQLGIPEHRFRLHQVLQLLPMLSHQLGNLGHRFKSVPVLLLLLRYRYQIARNVPIIVTTFPGVRSSVTTLISYGLRQWSVGFSTGADCGGVLATKRLKKIRMAKSADSSAVVSNLLFAQCLCRPLRLCTCNLANTRSRMWLDGFALGSWMLKLRLPVPH
jgi:hypothetical protein